jgi:hypothetical protein
MKSVAMLLLTALAGCATASAPLVSARQVHDFRAVVRQAEAAGALDLSSEAGRVLAEAKSDFYYAQHLPADPDRARRIAAQAQLDAERALRMARGDVPRELALGHPSALSVTPPGGP